MRRKIVSVILALSMLVGTLTNKVVSTEEYDVSDAASEVLHYAGIIVMLREKRQRRAENPMSRAFREETFGKHGGNDPVRKNLGRFCLLFSEECTIITSYGFVKI